MESHKLELRVEKLEAFLRFLSAACAEIRYSSMPVASILQSHSEGISFFSKIKGEDAKKDWLSTWNGAVSEYAPGEGFSQKDVELLKGFGAGFGTSDTQGQLAHFSLYQNLASAALKGAREDRSRKSKLYLMLGIFGGISAAILLC